MVLQALKGARAVIVAGRPGPHLLRLAQAAQVEHLVLPSLAGKPLPPDSSTRLLFEPRCSTWVREPPALRCRGSVASCLSHF